MATPLQGATPSIATRRSGGGDEKVRESAEQSHRDWSAVPDTALFSISTSLTGSLADVLAFGRVCRAWRSVAMANHRELMSSLPPLLFRDRGADFYCPADGRLYKNRRLTAFLEEEGPVEVAGCSFGHLIFAHLGAGDTKRGTFSIVNALTGARACQFPPNLRATALWAVLSSPPASPDCVLWSSCGRFIEFCRLGDQEWSVLLTKEPEYPPQPVFLGGKGYLNYPSNLEVFDINPCSKSTIVLTWGSLQLGPFDDPPLCASDAELLLAREVRNRRSGRIRGFNVCKFDFSVAKWVNLRSLGERALLLSQYNATVSENPGRWGGCGNCIFYVDLHRDQLSVFHLEDGKIECLAQGSPSNPLFSIHSPVWIIPSMCF